MQYTRIFPVAYTFFSDRVYIKYMQNNIQQQRPQFYLFLKKTQIFICFISI